MSTAKPQGGWQRHWLPIIFGVYVAVVAFVFGLHEWFLGLPLVLVGGVVYRRMRYGSYLPGQPSRQELWQRRMGENPVRVIRVRVAPGRPMARSLHELAKYTDPDALAELVDAVRHDRGGIRVHADDVEHARLLAALASYGAEVSDSPASPSGPSSGPL